MAESPSTYLPDVKAGNSPSFGKGYRTEIQTARSGREQRRRENTNPRRVFGFDTGVLSQADRKTMYDFLVARQGAYEAFYLFHPVPENVASYAAGSVTAATSITLPWKGPWWTGDTEAAATFVSATVGGVAPTDPVMTANIGAGGEDRLSWTGAMTGAVVITATNVRLRVTVRNVSDDIVQQFLMGAQDVLASFPLRFVELI